MKRETAEKARRLLNEIETCVSNLACLKSGICGVYTTFAEGKIIEELSEAEQELEQLKDE